MALPFEQFTSDASLAQLNAFSKTPACTGHIGAQFDASGVPAVDLQLTARWGFRDSEFARAAAVLRGDVVDPPACAVERLKTSFIALSTNPTRNPNAEQLNTPEMLRAAQWHLNAVLMTYPVLMHPALQVHVYHAGTSGRASVAHAIAMAGHARFPMEGDPGVGRAELIKFMANKSVFHGFTTRGIHTERSSTHTRGLRAMESAAKTGEPMHRLWASVDQLFDIARIDKKERNTFLGDLVPEQPRSLWSGKGAESYAKAFFAAAGVFDGEPFPPFLDAVSRNRYAGNAQLQQQVSLVTPSMVIGDMGDPVHGTITSRVDAIVNAMVQVKLADDAAEAAYLVCNSFGKHGTRLCESGEVVELMRAAHRHGAQVLDGKVFGLLAETERFATALHVYGTEVAMLERINKADVAEPSSGARPARRRQAP